MKNWILLSILLTIINCYAFSESECRKKDQNDLLAGCFNISSDGGRKPLTNQDLIICIAGTKWVEDGSCKNLPLP